MLHNQGHAGAPAAMNTPPPEPVAARLLNFQVAEDERRGDGGRPRRRLWLWLALLASLAAGGWAVRSRLMPSSVPEVETYTFTGKAAREVLLDLSGFVVPHTKVVISPQVGGIVSKVLLPEEGKTVQTGDLLFTIEDTRYRTELEQAEAALTTAQAQEKELEHGREKEEIDYAEALLKQAKVQQAQALIDYERAHRLYPGSISRAEHDRALTTYRDASAAVNVQKRNLDRIKARTREEKLEAAVAEVRRARAVRDRAKYFFEKTRIVAPADSEGKAHVFTVLQKNVNPGESIQADLTYTALCTLADLAQMEAEIDVQEHDLGVLKMGAPCEIIPDAYPDRVYRGHVHRKQPIINRQRGAVQVKITIDNPDDYLQPDMNARVLLLKIATPTSTNEELPEIPRRALVSGSDAPSVFLFDGQVVRLRRIDLGATAGDRVQVRKGLLPGDKIILPGDQQLVEGQPVRLRGENKGDAGRRDPL
jgi:RND family efflux transporter MFP subunit